MSQNGGGGLLLVRAEPLRLAVEIARKMVNVVQVVDGTLLLHADPAWAGALNTVLVKKSVRVSELRPVRQPQQTGRQLAAMRLGSDEERGDLRCLSANYHRGDRAS
jgi:hypothetical protein